MTDASWQWAAASIGEQMERQAALAFARPSGRGRAPTYTTSAGVLSVALSLDGFAWTLAGQALSRSQAFLYIATRMAERLS